MTNPLHVADGHYSMALDALEKTIEAEHPTMMIVCNPHNPYRPSMGCRHPFGEWRHLRKTQRAYSLSDGICRPGSARHGTHPTASVSDTAAAITVTLGAPSKSFNIPGIASAWTVVIARTASRFLRLAQGKRVRHSADFRHITVL